ncbi:hypothetical protein B0H14DRAFT_2607712 [Mycena olivaceomarginata]|nr:hypothetical protein B0H14DRAFT_2607712 [Mycena olivaceomarginata]
MASRLDEQYGFQRTIAALPGKRQDEVSQFTPQSSPRYRERNYGESYASTDDCFHTRYGARRGGSGDHQDFVRLGGGPRGWPTWKSGERASGKRREEEKTMEGEEKTS